MSEVKTLPTTYPTLGSINQGGSYELRDGVYVRTEEPTKEPPGAGPMAEPAPEPPTDPAAPAAAARIRRAA